MRAVKDRNYHSIYHQFYNSPYHFVAVQQIDKWLYRDAAREIVGAYRRRSAKRAVLVGLAALVLGAMIIIDIITGPADLGFFADLACAS